MATQDTSRIDRFVDIASLFLISAAAVLSAFCSYQSGRWNGEESRLYSQTNAYYNQASEVSDRNNVLNAIDVATFLNFLSAYETHDEAEVAFLSRRFRPVMLSAMNAWLATRPLKNPHAPSSPFVMPQYVAAQRAESRRYSDLAKVTFAQAVEADHHAVNYLLLTTVFAGVSFLAGLSTKMQYPRHAILILFATIGFVYGVGRFFFLKIH